MKTLLIGYGNPGRLDDALGPLIAEAIEHTEIEDVTVDSNYQLTVEDADAVARHDIVIFADAAVNGSEPFFFKEIKPKAAHGFSSHVIEPEVVLWMAHSLFKAKTRGYALGIRGYEFNKFGERLSSKAKDNLIDAVEFIKKALREKKFTEVS